jgi:hypothetical protein
MFAVSQGLEVCKYLEDVGEYQIYGIAITPPVSSTPTETPIYGYLKVPKIPSIKSELAAAAAN